MSASALVPVALAAPEVEVLVCVAVLVPLVCTSELKPVFVTNVLELESSPVGQEELASGVVLLPSTAKPELETLA